MLKKLYKPADIPVADLERIGLAKEGKILLNDNDRDALLSGRRTEMLRLENLRGAGLHIDRIDVKLSMRKNEQGKPELLLHPIYKTVQVPDALTADEANKLIKQEAVNIEKIITEKDGRKKEMLMEFDEETREFIMTAAAQVVAPDFVNGEELSPEQKMRFRKGKEVELNDGTVFRFSGSASQGILANRIALIASVILDGGLSYILYKGLHSLLNKKHEDEAAAFMSEGYQQALEDMRSDAGKKSVVANFSANNEYSRGFSRSGASR